MFDRRTLLKALGLAPVAPALAALAGKAEAVAPCHEMELAFPTTAKQAMRAAMARYSVKLRQPLQPDDVATWNGAKYRVMTYREGWNDLAPASEWDWDSSVEEV